MTVATVLEPGVRARLDAAAQGYFTPVHAERLPDALRAIRHRPVNAVLLSPHAIERDELPALGTLVARFPGVPTVAVLTRHDPRSAERLLLLGAYGVRHLVDVTVREGWTRLRTLVAHPGAATSAAILGTIIPALGDATEGVRRFFEILVHVSPHVASVRALTRELRVRPSTLMSRFFRAGLPSPKRYLAASRLLHVAALLEVPGLSIADAAYRMEYSSPQSFGRHIRAMVGLTAGEFRRRYALDPALEEFVQHLIVPFRATFRTFSPLDNGVAGAGHVRYRSSRKGTIKLAGRPGDWP